MPIKRNRGDSLITMFSFQIHTRDCEKVVKRGDDVTFGARLPRKRTDKQPT